MICPRCAKENDPDNRFCGRCGLDFTEYDHEPKPAPGEELFCYRHKRTPTNLRCGRCDKPICTKCTVMGPAGPRCPECGKMHIPIRGRAIAHEAKRSVSSLFRGGPWTIYLLIICVMMLLGFFRGCGESRRSAPPVQYEQGEEQGR